eukprot:1183996-Pleurochrysis_carterae.AAC.1
MSVRPQRRQVRSYVIDAINEFAAELKLTGALPIVEEVAEEGGSDERVGAAATSRTPRRAARPAERAESTGDRLGEGSPYAVPRGRGEASSLDGDGGSS